MEQRIKITLPVNGAYQPCDEKLATMTSDFYAYLMPGYVVTSAHGTEFHGMWTSKREAESFARSLPRSIEGNAKVEMREPYYYCHAAGVVSREMRYHIPAERVRGFAKAV
jgi:hypothetical protein